MSLGQSENTNPATPKERGAADLIDLTTAEQQELFAGCRAWLALGVKFGPILPVKAMLEISVEMYPELTQMPVELRGALLAEAVRGTEQSFLEIAHDCLMPDCGCGQTRS